MVLMSRRSVLADSHQVPGLTLLWTTATCQLCTVAENTTTIIDTLPVLLANFSWCLMYVDASGFIFARTASA